MDKPKILVVEDNLIQQKVISLLADEYGYDAIIVGDCPEALAAMQDAIQNNDSFQLILMDVRLPGESGIVCAEKIRALPEIVANPVPVVVMTGYVDPDKGDEYLAAGMDDYLAKPFSAKEFQEIVTKWTKCDRGAEPASRDS